MLTESTPLVLQINACVTPLCLEVITELIAAPIKLIPFGFQIITELIPSGLQILIASTPPVLQIRA